MFGPNSLAKINAVKPESLKSDEARLSLRRLKASIELINQSVGDALSVMLFVECVLLLESLTLEKWDAAYTDLASRQLKAKVKDRSLFKTTKADTELVAPAGFQDIINKHVSQFKSGRCFVRPSGTEDVVRVYAEAETQQEADQLGNLVLEDLKRFS